MMQRPWLSAASSGNSPRENRRAPSRPTLIGTAFPARSAALGAIRRSGGTPAGGNGVVNNELYAGVLVWNRQRFIKDPNTGKRVSRPNPEAKWIRTEVPELRIVDEVVAAGKAAAGRACEAV